MRSTFPGRFHPGVHCTRVRRFLLSFTRSHAQEFTGGISSLRRVSRKSVVYLCSNDELWGCRLDYSQETPPLGGLPTPINDSFYIYIYTYRYPLKFQPRSCCFPGHLYQSILSTMYISCEHQSRVREKNNAMLGWKWERLFHYHLSQRNYISRT